MYSSLYRAFRSTMSAYQTRAIGWWLLGGMSLAQSACIDHLDPPSPIVSGLFELTPADPNHFDAQAQEDENPKGDAADPEHLALRISYDAQNQIEFLVQGQVQLTHSFSRRDESDWSTGCHTNNTHTPLEVVDINAERIEFAGLTIEQPILVQTCGGDILELWARAPFDKGATYCTKQNSCLLFRE